MNESQVDKLTKIKTDLFELLESLEERVVFIWFDGEHYSYRVVNLERDLATAHQDVSGLGLLQYQIEQLIKTQLDEDDNVSATECGSDVGVNLDSFKLAIGPEHSGHWIACLLDFCPESVKYANMLAESSRERTFPAGIIKEWSPARLSVGSRVVSKITFANGRSGRIKRFVGVNGRGNAWWVKFDNQATSFMFEERGLDPESKHA